MCFLFDLFFILSAIADVALQDTKAFTKTKLLKNYS